MFSSNHREVEESCNNIVAVVMEKVVVVVICNSRVEEVREMVEEENYSCMEAEVQKVEVMKMEEEAMVI